MKTIIHISHLLVNAFGFLSVWGMVILWILNVSGVGQQSDFVNLEMTTDGEIQLRRYDHKTMRHLYRSLDSDDQQWSPKRDTHTPDSVFVDIDQAFPRFFSVSTALIETWADNEAWRNISTATIENNPEAKLWYFVYRVYPNRGYFVKYDLHSAKPVVYVSQSGLTETQPSPAVWFDLGVQPISYPLIPMHISNEIITFRRSTILGTAQTVATANTILSSRRRAIRRPDKSYEVLDLETGEATKFIDEPVIGLTATNLHRDFWNPTENSFSQVETFMVFRTATSVLLANYQDYEIDTRMIIPEPLRQQKSLQLFFLSGKRIAYIFSTNLPEEDVTTQHVTIADIDGNIESEHHDLWRSPPMLFVNTENQFVGAIVGPIPALHLMTGSLIMTPQLQDFYQSTYPQALVRFLRHYWKPILLHVVMIISLVALLLLRCQYYSKAAPWYYWPLVALGGLPMFVAILWTDPVPPQRDSITFETNGTEVFA